MVSVDSFLDTGLDKGVAEELEGLVVLEILALGDLLEELVDTLLLIRVAAVEVNLEPLLEELSQLTLV